jgi:ribulose kinase
VGEVVGPLDRDVAEQFGLRAGVPVVTGGGDAFVALLGQGVVRPGDMGVVMGSSNVLCLLTDQEVHFPGIFGSFPEALLPGLNLVEAGQVSTGSILSWFRRNFAQDLETEAKAKGLSVYQLLDVAAARVPVGADGLIVLDYFQGNRTPHTDSAARGAIWGLSLQSSRDHIYRALMEGIAYGMRDILEVFARRGFAVSRIIASGGGTRSPLLMRICADVLGKPLYVTREPEASLLGSAILAAVGAGAYADPVEAAREMVTISGEYQPDMKHHEEYEFYFRSYQQTYPQLAGLMSSMSRKLG